MHLMGAMLKILKEMMAKFGGDWTETLIAAQQSKGSYFNKL